MGSYTTLGIGRLELDWQKNHIANNHSALFQIKDLKTERVLQEPEYEDREPEFLNEKVLSRPLSEIKRRLDLLGYSMMTVESLYREECEFLKDLQESPPLSFEKFSSLVKDFNLDDMKINYEYYRNNSDLGELTSECIFKSENFKNTDIKISKDEGLFFENINPYITIRLLADNERNFNKNVIWSFQDLLNGGWVQEEDVFKPLEADKKFLIVTEGSSDTYILKKAISYLAPDVEDFFVFIDMKDNYPFTGTGNLLNFSKGLASIQVQNKILVIFDNDIEGGRHYNHAKKLKFPPTMKVVVLPELRDFESFTTVGTDGESVNNINGRAVSIECFLDLHYKLKPQDTKPRVRWKNFVEEFNLYHGALEYKETYTRRFLDSNLSKNSYDFSKLDFLVRFILNECSEIASLEKLVRS